MTPQQLLHKIKEEDSQAAFRELFEQQYDRLFRLSLHFLQNDEWAKEVALDVLANVWNGRHEMVIPDDFGRYTWTLVRNASYSLWRREQRFMHDEADGLDATFSLADATADPTERDELFRVYEQTLATLPDRCREVWQRVKEDGQSYAEVAQQMEISPKTVDAQLQKAVKHLRAAVGSYLEGNDGTRPHPSLTCLLTFLCV